MLIYRTRPLAHKAGHPNSGMSGLCGSFPASYRGQFALIVLLMIGAVEVVPYPVTVTFAVPFSAVPVAPAGGVYVAVTVQVPLGTYGDAGVVAVAGIAAIPGLIAVPTAQVPPSAQVPVPLSGVNVIAVGIYGPASTLVPAGHGVATHRVLVLVRVIVPVTAAVLAGFAAINGVVCVAGATATVAIESWPVSDTV